jgi:hypothetical protein
MSGRFLGRAWWHPSGLVVAGGVEGQLAEEFAGVAVDDADVEVVDEHGDGGAGAAPPDADVVEAAVVPQGEGAVSVETVGADAAVWVDDRAGGGGLGAGGVGLHGCVAVQRAVRADRVVVVPEPGQLAGQAAGGVCGWLRGEPLLLGLLEPFDLAAGLGVVGPGVVEPDAEAAELDLEGDAAAAALPAGEDRTVEFLTDVKPLRVA